MQRTAHAWTWGIAAVVLACGAGAGRLRAAETAKPKVVLFFGVYTQWYGFDRALADYDVKVSDAHSERAKYFPPVKELLKTRLLVLSDVKGTEFTRSWIGQIKQYVRRGGSVLVMGGPFTLGLGTFAENGMGDMLPVGLEPFDLKWEKQGQAIVKAADHPLLKDVDLSKRPMVYWIHRVKPKPDAKVVLKAGDYPCLIVGQYGKGKVAVFTGTPMGVPPKGHTPFWKWDGWTRVVTQTADWLAGKGGAR